MFSCGKLPLAAPRAAEVQVTVKKQLALNKKSRFINKAAFLESVN